MMPKGAIMRYTIALLRDFAGFSPSCWAVREQTEHWALASGAARASPRARMATHSIRVAQSKKPLRLAPEGVCSQRLLYVCEDNMLYEYGLTKVHKTEDRSRIYKGRFGLDRRPV